MVLWYTQIVYITIVISLAFLGNVIIFIAICRIRRLHTIDNVFIANLAVSDFLFTLIETCSNTTRWHNRTWEPPHDFVCYVIMASSVLCASASVFTQTAVAVNRHLAITRPLQYPNFVSKTKIYISILVIWISAIALASPPLIWRPHEVICGEVESYDEKPTFEMIYMTLEWIFIFIIPFGTMSAIYFKIYRTARNHASRVKPGTSEETASHTDTGGSVRRIQISHFKRQLKAAKMLVTIAGAFLVSWLPFFVTLTLWKFQKGIQIDSKVFTTFLYIVYTLPGINPAIYAFWSRDVQKGINSFWCVGKKADRKQNKAIERKNERTRLPSSSPSL